MHNSAASHPLEWHYMAALIINLHILKNEKANLQYILVETMLQFQKQVQLYWMFYICIVEDVRFVCNVSE